jgi:isocitrate dehydrogenase
MSRKIPITVANGDGIVIDNRGTTVWPGGKAETFTTDSFRCRFQPGTNGNTTAAGYDIVKTETLRTFDGQQGFTLAQGQ